MCEPRTITFRQGVVEPFYVQPLLYAPGIKSNHTDRPHPLWLPGWLGETGGAHDEWLCVRGFVFPMELPRGCWAGLACAGLQL